MSGPHDRSEPVPRDAPIDLSALEIPHPDPFICDLRIRPGDLGEVIEHVANTGYLRWLDRSAELHADAIGFTRTRLLDEGIMWFVARHEIDYLAEVWRDDELILATWVRDMHKVKSWRDYVIFRPADGTVVSRAATLWVLVDLETRRPIRIRPDMADLFRPLEAMQVG